MLKLIFSDDSAAEKSFTGMETRPKAICAVAIALGMMEPQKQSHTPGCSEIYCPRKCAILT
jgi:hypothetical protein